MIVYDNRTLKESIPMTKIAIGEVFCFIANQQDVLLKITDTSYFDLNNNKYVTSNVDVNADCYVLNADVGVEDD